MAIAGNGDPDRALRLAASAEALWESFGHAISVPFWDALLDRYIGTARDQLGERAAEIWAKIARCRLTMLFSLRLPRPRRPGARSRRRPRTAQSPRRFVL